MDSSNNRTGTELRLAAVGFAFLVPCCLSFTGADSSNNQPGTGGAGGSGGKIGDSGLWPDGASPGGTGGVAGAGGTACVEAWRKTFTGASLGHIALGTSAVYALGTQNDQAWVARIDRCTGTSNEKDFSVTGWPKTGAYDAVLADGALIVGGAVSGGSDPADAMFARLDATSLSVEWSNVIVGSAGQDEIWGIAKTSNEGLWLAGATNTSLAPKPWAIRASTSGVACGFAVDSTVIGHAQAIAASGDDIYVISNSNAGDQLIVRHYVEGTTGCTSTAPCGCAPVATSAPISLGGYTDGRGAHVVGNDLYVVGRTGTVLADSQALVARIALPSLTLAAKYLYDGSGMIDSFIAVASDASSLYVGGLHGYDGTQPDLSSAKGVLIKLPLAFPENQVPDWTRQLSTVDNVSGLEIDATDGGLYVGAVISGSVTDSVVMRCDTEGNCPP